MASLRYQIRTNIFDEYMPNGGEKRHALDYYGMHYGQQDYDCNREPCWSKHDINTSIKSDGKVQNGFDMISGESVVHQDENEHIPETNQEYSTTTEIEDKSLPNKNKVDESKNKQDQGNKRKTSITVNGNLVSFPLKTLLNESWSANSAAHHPHIKCVRIELNENKVETRENENKARENITFDSLIEQLQDIELELSNLEGTCEIQSKNSFAVDDNIGESIEKEIAERKSEEEEDLEPEESKYKSSDFPYNYSNTLEWKTEEIFFHNRESFDKHHFANSDAVNYHQSEVNFNTVVDTNKSQVDIIHQNRHARRRSLSEGDAQFTSINTSILRQLSSSVNHISCCNSLHENNELSSSECESSDNENLAKSFPRKSPNKRSFIGKSISVDLVNEDCGFISSNTRRRGVFFDSTFGSKDSDFLTDLLAFKQKYKNQKRSKSTGLRIARSVENLLKIDKPTTQRNRSNTDTKETKVNPKKRTSFLNKHFFSTKSSKMDLIRETTLLDDDGDESEYDAVRNKKSPNIHLVGMQKVAGIIEMYMDKKGDVIRKIEIRKIQGQSLGFFIRFGNGIERENGIFLSRVTLGSFVDVNNLLHAGDEILSINKVDVTGYTLEDVALMLQRSDTLIIKTRSALPLPIHAYPFLKSFDFPTSEKNNISEWVANGDTLHSHHRSNSDPLLLSDSSEDESSGYRIRSHTTTDPSRDELTSISEQNNKMKRSRNKSENEKYKRYNVRDAMKSPILNRLQVIHPETIAEDDIANTKSFSRAQKYLSKSPTRDGESIEEVKSAKTSFIKSPRFFRKFDGKKVSNGGHLLSAPSNDSLSSTSDNESCSPTQLDRTQVYSNDGSSHDVSIKKAFNGRLTVNIQKLLGRPSSLEGNCYITLEVNDEYKATTQLHVIKDVIHIQETFEIELRQAYVLTFYIFHRHAKKQNKLVSQSSIHLANLLEKQTKMELLLATTNQVQIRVGIEFTEARRYLQRSPSSRNKGVFGFNLSQTLVEEENTVPVLVRKCVEEIEKRGLDQVGIYRISGSARKKKILRMQFEENSMHADVSDPEIDCHVIAGILKDYLRELPRPLISQDTYLNIYNKSLEKTTELKTKRLLGELMKKLPYTNRATLIYLMEHLQRIAERSAENKMDFKNLAVCFGPVMMCPPITKASSITDMFDFKKQIQALEFLLSIWPNKTEQNGV